MRVIAPFFGAIAFEVVHWYHLREKLSQKRVQAVLRSREYWVITGLMIVCGGIGAIILGENLRNDQLAVFGAAFPSFLTKAIAAFKPESVKLGEKETVSATDVFI